MIQTLVADLTKPVLAGIAFASLLLGLASLLVSVITLSRSAALRRRYKELVRGETGADLESLIAANHRQTQEMSDAVNELRSLLMAHDMRLRAKSGTVSVIRYNAFAESGNDLSFSLSVLDESGTGVVLSSIYGREESRVYAKPIEKGKSTYTLTDEEKRVIQAAFAKS